AMKNLDPNAHNMTVMTVCAAVCVPMALASCEMLLPPTVHGLVGLAGVIATYFIGVIAFFAALKRIGAVRTALLSQLEPVVSVLAAILILQEHVTAVQAVGIALVMAALYGLAR